jgi:hypothetical protein
MPDYKMAYTTNGYLIAPYILLWMLARMSVPQDAEPLRQFLINWKFNDYAELLYLAAGKGLPRDIN